MALISATGAFDIDAAFCPEIIHFRTFIISTRLRECSAESFQWEVESRLASFAGQNGVAADLWTVNTPGFIKRDRVRNGQVQMPPVNSFVIWSRQLGGTGHVAMVIGSVNGTTKTVRVVDTNWNSDGKGLIHDISVNDSRILGYLVWQ